MPRNKDPARKLAEFKKRATAKTSELRESLVYRDKDGKLIEQLGAIEQKETEDWSVCPPEIRALEANNATTLRPFGYDDVTVRPFFKEFERDPNNPWHWRELFYFLIESHTRKPKRMTWTTERLHDLWLASQAYPNARNDTEILKSLIEDRPRDFGHMDEPGLRKRLAAARKRWAKVAP